MTREYSYGRQQILDDDIQEVINVLKSPWLTQGPKISEFENNLKEKFGSKFSSVVSNGTAALHLIGIALGWKKNDIVITTPITFLATANSILYSNARPDFVDIDARFYTLDVEKLEQKIVNYKKKGMKIKAVIAVDYAGQPNDWKALKELSNKYKFLLVNDNCHALNAEIDGDSTYAVKFADIVAMSFHPVKHITTGEGGAILTNNAILDEKIKILRTHGVTKNQKYLEQNDGPWYYEMHELGFNYRITDFQCALGISQLKKLDEFVNKRNWIASYYNKAFKNDERFIIPKVRKNVRHAYHLYPLQINFNKLKINKKVFFEEMKTKRINLQVHYIPVHLQPFYRKKFGFKVGDFPVAETFYRREVSLPIYPQLGEDDLSYIIKTIKAIAK